MSARMIILPPARRLQALRLRKLKHSWESVSRVLGISQETIRKNIDPEYAQQRRSLSQQKRERERHPCADLPRAGMHVVIHRPTQDMLHQREVRRAVPLTLTQSICGDPPPGYSALDRRGGA